ncbi:diacylglycerol/lipid kinase family protein [Ferruginivarius sediminum]|uniref:diacylglycerol/lipid kinase family protein n=1 Tax=Ferruginivarius sediminum TaxID=2661937 RepID=UPI0013794F6B|nr:diacylglycerol kinase family protein [Ferruginivarius sediminum]
MAAVGHVTRLAVLSNRRSGGSHDHLEQVGAVADAHGLLHVATGELDELEGALKSFAARGVEILAINGGDGTLDAALTAMRNRHIFEREPAIALLRGGTTNMVHDDVGLSGKPANALSRLISACQEAVPDRLIRSRRAIAVRRGDAGEATYGFFFGTAAVPRAIRMTRQRLHTRGLAGPVGDSLSLIWTMLRLATGHIANDPVLHPEPLSWSLDGGAWHEAETVLMVATTLDRLLLGLRPVSPDGGFGVAGLTWPYRRLWLRLPAFVRGRGADRGGGLWRARGERLAVCCGAGYTLDGELFEAPKGTPIMLDAAPPVRFVLA